MKVRQVVKGAVKPFVDVPTWTGYKQFVEMSKGIFGPMKDMFVPQQATIDETYEQALKRLGLTDTDIAQRHKEFTRLMVIYIGIAVLLFAYTFYLIWMRSIHGAIAGFAISLVAVVQAFRYNFWLFQLRERKLGCTFKEWLNSGFLGKK